MNEVNDQNNGGTVMRWAIVALALAACLPFLFTAYPQMTDYPSHLARYYVMLDGGQNAMLDRYYSFEWALAGNLGADILMVPIGQLLGVENAAWLIGFLLAPLTGLGIVTVEWTLRRHLGFGSVLALVTIWSPAMIMGFYNFCLSVALALFAFALWVKLEHWRWRWAVFLLIAPIIWICHVSGWGVLGILVFGYEWHRRKHWRAALAPWPLFPPFLLFLAGSANPGLSYGNNPVAYKIGIWFKALRDQSLTFDILTLAALLGALLIALRARKIDGRLGWAALALFVLTFAMPRHLGGGDYADWRLIAVALMIGSLSIDWKAPRWMVLAVAALFLGRLTVTTIAWHQSSDELEHALQAMDALPRGARVAGAVVVPAAQWASDPFEHAPSYATVRRDALVNSHFAVPGVHMLQVKEGGRGFVDPSQRIMWSKGQIVDLERFAPASHADYIWYFGKRAPDVLPPGAQLVHRTPRSLLLRLAKAQERR